jgi:hypothetical protein
MEVFNPFFTWVKISNDHLVSHLKFGEYVQRDYAWNHLKSTSEYKKTRVEN